MHNFPPWFVAHSDVDHNVCVHLVVFVDNEEFWSRLAHVLLKCCKGIVDGFIA